MASHLLSLYISLPLPRKTVPFAVSALSVLLLMIKASHAQSAYRHSGSFIERNTQIIVDGFVDPDYCWRALSTSDKDADLRVTPNEYVQFAKLLEPGVLPDSISTFDQLPVAFVAAFDATACLCKNPLAGGDAADVNCCKTDNAHIRVTTEPTLNDINTTEVNYLYTACAMTSGAAEIVRNSLPPAPIPTMTPTTLSPSTAVPVPTPTMPPTLKPITAMPVIRPTMTPHVVSTESPLSEPTAPSSMPTSIITTAPTKRVESQIQFEVALDNGQSGITDPLWTAEYLGNMVVALDILSVRVAESIEARRLRAMHRQLSASVIRPSKIEAANDIQCPTNIPEISKNRTLCQIITALVRLDVSSETIHWTFDANLQQAILNGKLQDELDLLLWPVAASRNPVTVLTGLEPVDPPNSSRESSVENLSNGAITGISLAVLFFALVPIGYFVFNRHQPQDETEPLHKPAYQEYQPDEEMEHVSDGSINTEMAHQSVNQAIVGATTLGAATADYGKRELLAEPGMELEDDDDDDDDGATSSNAGSSGWSSSAGISSLNTGSLDEDHVAAAAATTLAGIGVASALSRKQKETPSDTDEAASDLHSVSRDQLDQLIEAGDWAAVGATAALLAAASDSQSANSVSRNSAHKSRDSQSADAARAAELDHLVDAGDWEGVVAAAAKFESEAHSKSEGSRTHSEDASTASGTGTGTGSGTGSGTGTGTMSDTPSKMQKREEMRAEVEALVRRVVPEEIDNVDEMLNQFKGREEELVETLRTMQERAVAQKARQAGQKSAKMEARRNVQRGVVPGASAVVSKVASLEIKEAASGTGGGSNAGAGIASRSPKNKESEKDTAGKISKEEEDALKEADLWMKIAEQKKAEGATDAGASDAAEWAIQRSLSQLRNADKKNVKKGNSEEDEV